MKFQTAINILPTACQNINLLLHSGTSQPGRVLKALHPSFAQIDERSAADLILFAKEYAKYLAYYSSANEVDGNWQPLMRMDLSVVLATLSTQRVAQYIGFIQEEFAWLADRQNLVEADLKNHLTLLFNFTYSWLYELEIQSQALPAEWPFKEIITNKIRSVLAALRYKLDVYYDKASAEHLVSSGVLQPSLLLPFSVYSVNELRVQQWQPEWTLVPDPMQSFNPQFYGTTVVSKIKNLAVHNLFTGLFDGVFKQASVITQEAAKSLEESFNDFPKHTPHYALFLTFIKLFRFAQNELNGFTQRHLNLYYREILQLKPKPPVPDAVHLTIELQKTVAQYLIPKDTLFKAGKDAAGNELFYAAEKDVVINKASIGSIKSLFAVSKKSGASNYQSVYASPVTASADGKGKAIKGDDKSWPPFGQPLADNLATFGFAIASHLLFMQEGDRVVTLTFEATQALPSNAALFKTKPSVKLSGEKGWEEATVNAFLRNPTNAKQFYLLCSLTPKAAAILPFNATVHKNAFDTSYPVLKATFNSNEGYNALADWASIQLSSINLNVAVSGVKKLVVKNDLSVLDTAKPFQPFGPQPYAGSACIIGSNEIFMKEGAAVTLNFEWDKVPQPEGIISHMSFINADVPVSKNIIDIRHDTFYDYDGYVLKSSAAQLQAGNWSPAQTAQNIFTSLEMFGADLVDHIKSCGQLDDLRARHLFTSYAETNFTAPQYVNVSFTVHGSIEPDFTATKPFSNDSLAGFVKLELNRDTGYKNYVQRFTQLAAKQQKPPLEPYVPQAKLLTADYNANVKLDFSSTAAKPLAFRKWQFFSVHPFGVKEENVLLNTDSSFGLVPSFSNEGEMYIGLADAVTDTTVSILFQVSEGSANPLKTKQEVVWSYLSAHNVWKPFADGKVSDDTNGLLHSGIIAFALPADASPSQTLIGKGFHWLKASIKQSSDAVCDLLELKPQAIKASWTNVQNSSVSYTQPTKAGTILKLLHALPSIKKTEQPYDSFGGRLAESEEAFYLRSSERLRHKRRAITIWDYEHLVLEAFPEIYKVKCLNHTAVRMDASGAETGDNEAAPGCVVVVPVPDISALHSRNPLRPLTSLDTLSKIEDYLKKITSGFVRLQARNPVFEEILIQCDVKFFGNDPGYYHDVLLDDLQAFLCPWAYDANREVEFGGKISKSVLINFMEERPYVDYLTRFKLFLRKASITIPIDREEVSASTSRSVLVPAVKGLHKINYQNIKC